jgi:hypothetical protein
MTQNDKLLNLMNTLILSSMENIVTTDKTTLQSIIKFLQVSKDKVALLQTHT